MLRTNVAAIERPIRTALGAGLAGYAWLGLPAPNLVMIAMGVCVALAGILGFCPACAIVGRRVRPKGCG